MRNTLVSILFLLLFLSGCKKDDFNGGEASHPDIPVTVTNVFGFFNGVPTVSTSFGGGGAITVTLAIPEGKGRTIKEISRVGVATTPTNYKVVQTASGLYSSGPIAGAGTSVTFTTSLAEYTTKTGLAVTANGTATSFLGRYFFFLVTLDNGEQILPQAVRVYVGL